MLSITGHSHARFRSITLRECPFHSHPNPSVFFSIRSDARERCTCMNTHTKSMHTHLFFHPARKGEQKERGREECNGGWVTSHHGLANSAKSGPSVTEVPCFLSSSHSQKDCLRPLLPPNPNDIEKKYCNAVFASASKCIQSAVPQTNKCTF